MNLEKDLLELKERGDSLRRKRDELKGEEKLLNKKLKEQGFSNIKEAKEALKEAKKEHMQLEDQIEKDLQKLNVAIQKIEEEVEA